MRPWSPAAHVDGSAAVVNSLLQHGANVNVTANPGGMTALMWAAQQVPLQGHDAGVPAHLSSGG